MKMNNYNLPIFFALSSLLLTVLCLTNDGDDYTITSNSFDGLESGLNITGTFEEEYDAEEDGNLDESPSTSCSAQFLLDKILPDDIPGEISKEVRHINETIERLNKSVGN